MHYKRRNFLKLTANLAAGVTLAPIACKLMPKKETGLERNLDMFGIQLYSVSDSIAKNPKEVLKQLASFGYK